MKIPRIFYFFVVASILVELMLSFSMRPGFSLLGEKGEPPLNKPKIYSFPSLQENPLPVGSLHTKFLFLPLNNNFNVITLKNFIFSCNHCSYTAFILTLYALYTLVMSVFILIDVQYLQNVVFSFENSSNGQNHSSSVSNHRTENSS